jgi:hypothetical protein
MSVSLIFGAKAKFLLDLVKSRSAFLVLVGALLKFSATAGACCQAVAASENIPVHGDSNMADEPRRTTTSMHS